MADETGARTVHAATTSTTAESVALTRAVRQVRITNRDTDSTLYVTKATGRTAAAAEANLVTAVAQADETIVIAAGQTRVVGQSAKPVFYAFSVIGNATDYSVEGFEIPVDN